MLTYATLKDNFNHITFFKDKTWELSPSPLKLSPQIHQEINEIAPPCFEFLKAINKLYFTSKQNKSLLRNKELILDWIPNYFERGKSPSLLNHLNHPTNKHPLPHIIRPDLLLTKEGLMMTELEVIPGGIGLTSFLHRIYETKFTPLLGSSEKMLEGFYQELSSLTKTQNPTITILTNEESSMYTPEFEWLSNELRKRNKKVFTVNVNDIFYDEHNLKFKFNNEIINIDIIYRFFELFDLNNMKEKANIIINAIEEKAVTLTPPLNPIYEEKLTFALFHHYQLDDFWKENLSKKSHQILHQIIPKTWIIDPTPFGPNAILNGPLIENKPLKSWQDMKTLSQKNRNFVIKRSGYHNDAWGAKSVTLGTDSSQSEWAEALNQAINESEKAPFILQEFKKPITLTHPIYNQEGISQDLPGRVRLCPYYIKNKESPELCAILATICPADKKIIHGMSAATFVPCIT